MNHDHLRRWLRRVFLGVLFADLLTVGVAAAQVPNVTIGTNPAGTVFYAVGSGIAKVASESGKVKMSIQPYTGSSTFIPLLNTGEIDFGMVNAVDMALAYRGPSFKVGGRNPFPYAPHLRLVMRGSPLMVGLLVRKDSPIKTIYDVKGKRLTGEYPAQLAVWYNMFGHLASAGLTWSDVKIVPVPAVNDGVDALLQGRADVSQHALNSAKVREADATVGVRHLSNDCSPDGDKRVRAAVPGYYSQVVKAGGAAAVIEDGCFIAYDIYFGAGQATSEAAVEATLRAIWENVEKLAPIHPVLREWTRDKAIDPDVTIPYHPGAIRFYKERGVWKPGMDQVQQKLLATKP